MSFFSFSFAPRRASIFQKKKRRRSKKNPYLVHVEPDPVDAEPLLVDHAPQLLLPPARRVRVHEVGQVRGARPQLRDVGVPSLVLEEDVGLHAVVIGLVPSADVDDGVEDGHPALAVGVELVDEGLHLGLREALAQREVLVLVLLQVER